MAIITSAGKDTVGAYNTWPKYNGEREGSKNLPIIKFAVGCVLDKYERNQRDDSDFYATYWDEDTQSIQSIQYATTRGYTYHCSASVDATEEVIEKAAKWQIEKDIKKSLENDVKRVAEPQPRDINKGTRVVLKKDVSFKDKRRNKTVEAKAGDAGEIIWSGEKYSNRFNRSYTPSHFGPYAHDYNVGVKFENGDVVFTAMEDVSLDRKPITEAEARAKIEKRGGKDFRSAHHYMGGMYYQQSL